MSVESDTGSATSSTSSSSRSMDVSLCILGGFNLDDQVNAGNIKTTGSNIGSNQDLEFVLLEALKSDFTLVLSNITVHDFDLVLDLVRQQQLVRFQLG